ncbi:MAG TPA: glycosyltransferase family 4 protein [Geminicoccaceae bacterium]|nr:glycosyltransferase family 4 protein [Geminicoccaceae bacterium]
MNRPRVLLIAQNHPELVPGGTEIVARDLFRALKAAGRAEALFLACVTRLHRPPRPEGLLQTLAGAHDELLLWTGRYDRFLMSRLDPEAFAATIGRLLEAFRPDIVHLHHLSRIGPEVLPLIRRLRPAARLVVTLHDYAAICANGGLMTKRPAGELCRAASPDACRGCFPEIPFERFGLRRLHLLNLLSCVDRFLAPSHFLKGRYVAWGLAAERIEVVPNAVPTAPTLRPPGPELRHRFGFFGNVVPHKGVRVLLEAARQLAAERADLRIVINGGLHFPEAGFAAEVAEGLRDAAAVARHAGIYARDELAGRMAEVGWVVVPSVWWENAPLVILEAFRHGRPVICSGIGGMAELVRDGIDGLHVRPGDAVGLAETLRRAAHEPGLWERLRAGLPTVPTLEDQVERHHALYADLLAAEESLCA